MFSKLIVVGRLGRDPELKYTPAGQAVCKFSVATDRKYSANGEAKRVTTWYTVSAWGKTAEACNQYLRKGSMVLVEGRIDPDPATGAPRMWSSQDGTSKCAYEVTASEVRFLSTNSNEGESMTSVAQSLGGAPADEDYPF